MLIPESAQALINITSAMLPRIKITELLMDVDDWTGYVWRQNRKADDGQFRPLGSATMSEVA